MRQPRLELTWANKHLRLLAHDDGHYEWVDPSDPRATEVRLLRDVETVGDVGTRRAADNLLIRGDAGHALTSLARIPEFAAEYLGKVKLVYIDPPFNTGRTFAHYDDALEHSVWLTMMRDRLLQIRDLLAPDGTVWLHLDDRELHRARCVMDEVFGAVNYRNTVIWRRTTGKSSAVHSLGTMHESILVYAGSEAASFNHLFQAHSEAYLASKYGQSDDRGPFRLSDLTATGMTNGDSGAEWRGFNVSAKGRHWATPKLPHVYGAAGSSMGTRAKLDALDGAGYIHWPERGGMPSFKRYLDTTKGVAIGDLWTDIVVINSQSHERSGFDTQKPEALLERIIHLNTKPDDIVLDCFLGSGTAAAVAHKMGRRWVGVEREAATVAAFVVPRLRKVVAGEDAGGVTAETAWTGGGGFRILDAAPPEPP